MSKPIVSLVNVEKWYGTNHVVKNMNINIAEGEFLTLLGPSGCGKTTTLRMISGFELPTSGVIKVQGESVEKKEPYQRDVNTVFQNYALFPNMNVFDNVAYGLKVKKVPKAEIKERVTEMLKLVQLEGFGKRRSTQMSGGQKQRVAIARALINRPKVLLLDEPLATMDDTQVLNVLDILKSMAEQNTQIFFTTANCIMINLFKECFKNTRFDYKEYQFVKRVNRPSEIKESSINDTKSIEELTLDDLTLDFHQFAQIRNILR